MSEQMVVDEVRENRGYIMEILQRLTRVEEKTSRTATLYGLLGGIISGVGALLLWFASQH